MGGRWVGAVVLLIGLGALGGCGGSDAAPSGVPARQKTVTVTVTASSSPSADDRLSLLGVCDNLGGAAGAAGGQGPRQAFVDFAQAVQTVADVSDDQSRRALQPLIDAANAGADAGDPSQPRWQAAENDAYRALAKKCDAAGSTALDGG